jgi:phytoene synthase
MRQCDDLSDEPGSSIAALESWREELNLALSGGPASHPLWPAFVDAVRRYGIPHRYFHEMIDGVVSDLSPRNIETFTELYDYCYHVASVVGLTIIHIFGFESPRALELAEKCGIGFQLTNILRDVGEDARMGRVYLPAEDLRRFELDRAAVMEGAPGFVELMRFEAQRARQYYCEAEPLIELVDISSRPALWALIRTYFRLLEHVEQSGFRVISQRVRVPAREKIAILAAGLLHKFTQLPLPKPIRTV